MSLLHFRINLRNKRLPNFSIAKSYNSKLYNLIIKNPHQTDGVEVAAIKSRTDEKQKISMTPLERNSCRSRYFSFGYIGWGCLRIGTELSRLLIPTKRVELSSEGMMRGVTMSSNLFDGIFIFSPLLPIFFKGV